MRHLSTLFLCATACSLSAQLQNGGFEALDTAGVPTYWTAGIELIPIGDVVVFDSVKYLLNTTDVHSGSNAMELRNAYNFTQDLGMPGRWIASPSELGYGGFPLQDVPVVQRPAALHFWADYAPVGGDSGQAEVRVVNEFLDEIGVGVVHIGATAGSYAEFYAPITYSSTDSAVAVRILFVTMVPDGNAHLGTRMLIDDVSIDYVTTGIAENGTETFDLFPNPANDEVRLSGLRPACIVRVLDAMGREAIGPITITDRFSVGRLQPGTYMVESREGERVRQSRLVIAR